MLHNFNKRKTVTPTYTKQSTKTRLEQTTKNELKTHKLKQTHKEFFGIKHG